MRNKIKILRRLQKTGRVGEMIGLIKKELARMDKLWAGRKAYP